VHHRKGKAAIASAKPAVAKAKPLRPPARPALASAAPVAQESGSSPALLIIVFGVLLAFVGVAVSQVPASALPFSMRIRLEQSRQPIMFVGFAIGAACALVGLLTVLLGA
jgi:hypothetical protein